LGNKEAVKAEVGKGEEEAVVVEFIIFWLNSDAFSANRACEKGHKHRIIRVVGEKTVRPQRKGQEGQDKGEKGERSKITIRNLKAKHANKRVVKAHDYIPR
jgi:hypothetical protein